MSLNAQRHSVLTIQRPVEEVRLHRQRAGNSNEQLEQLNMSGKFNILSQSTGMPGKLFPKQLYLFFHKKGYKEASRHGSASLIHLDPKTAIPNWQSYLSDLVTSHVSWKSFPKIREYEINPKLPICVGFWEGGNTLPNTNELVGQGTMADLLRLVQNPKIASLTASTASGTGKGGKRSTESIKMAFTVHIRQQHEDSDEDDQTQRDLQPLAVSTGKYFSIDSFCAKLNSHLMSNILVGKSTNKRAIVSSLEMQFQKTEQLPTHIRKTRSVTAATKKPDVGIELQDLIEFTSEYQGSETSLDTNFDCTLQSSTQNPIKIDPTTPERQTESKERTSTTLATEYASEPNPISSIRKRTLSILSPEQLSTRSTRDSKKEKIIQFSRTVVPVPSDESEDDH